MTLFHSICGILCDLVPGAKIIDMDTHLFRDVGINSLQFMMLLNEIERCYNIEFSIMEMEPCLTVSTLVETIMAKLEAMYDTIFTI